jgi:hypothetical protein
MQYFKLLTVIVGLSYLLSSCGSSTNANAGKGSASTASSNTNASVGDASFSAIIDGTAISGKEIDEMQLTNTAFIYPASENSPKRLLFFLNSDKKGEDFYSFRFSLPDKEGVYKFNKNNNENCHCYIRLDNNLRSSDNFSRYDEDSVMVAIDKITSSGISGTFSGNLKLSDDTRSKPYKSRVSVTDGKFDIPFSTGNLKPE